MDEVLVVFRLKFVVINEPPEEEMDCVEIGVAYVDVLQILNDTKDVINSDIPGS